MRDLRINAEDNIPQYIRDNVDSNRMLEELPSGGSDAENLEFGMVSMAATSEINDTDLNAILPCDELLLTQLGISEKELVSLAVKELNCPFAGLSKDDQKRLKARRKTLKNKDYAQICRTKRIISNDDLQQEILI